MTGLADSLAVLSFRHVVWLFPVATALHVREEWPGFPVWARRFGSERYSDREYVATHALTIGLAVVSAVAVTVVMRPWVVFAFFALVLGPACFWNGIFHLGATFVSRVYCPGAVTGTLLYLPLGVGLALLAVHDALVTPAGAVVALGVALVVHVAEVGHGVFKRW